MAEAHPTMTAKQEQTDEWAVFGEVPGEPNLQLIGRVEVPRYSQPDDDGVRLDRDKRLSLAVARVIESGDWFTLSSFDGDQYITPSHPDYEHHHQEMDGDGTVDQLEGVEFMVLTDLDESMSFVRYEQNPSFDGVWDPSNADNE